MKKFVKSLMVLSIVAVAGFGLAACDDSDDAAATSSFTLSNN